MKFYLDQEFIEGFYKPLFGKRRHFIELISIGLVAEDGREYYAISSEYDFSKANDWVRQNVIRPIYEAEVSETFRTDDFGSTHFVGMSDFHKTYGKPIKQIVQEIKEFICPSCGLGNDFSCHAIEDKITFYGDFADYDWVLFCSLFGTMMDLPKGFPMYCRDIRQTFDERVERIMEVTELDFERAMERVKRNPEYPVVQQDHHALYDAKYIKDLHKFLQKL